MRMRDLKDALKGKTERLERAEALLIKALEVASFAQSTESYCDHMIAKCLEDKIEHFFKKPIDNEK